MFGCCVAGRLVQTNLVQMNDHQFAFNLESASTVNHVCVFLLGTTPFPEGLGGAVYFNLPGKGFQLLGMISNQKPSAIFRVRSQTTAVSRTQTSDDMQMSDGDPVADTAVIGISIEPLQAIESQMASLTSRPAATAGVLVARNSTQALLTDPIWLSERILRHLFNYLASFTQNTGLGERATVEIGAIKRWYESFMTKLKTGGTAFLERQEA